MKKKWYEAPEARALEVKYDRNLCTSGNAAPVGNRQDYGAIEDELEF